MGAMLVELQISKEMAIWDDSFKYASKKRVFGAELVSPMKHVSNLKGGFHLECKQFEGGISSGTLSRISFQAGSFVLFLPFLKLLPKSKSFCSQLLAFVVINCKFF